MNIKKILFKLIITITLLECVYLFAIPAAMNNFAKTNHIKNIIKNRTNAELDYGRLKFKTHIIPALSINADYIKLLDKESKTLFINSKETNIKLSLIPLLFRNINVQQIASDNLEINLTTDKDNRFNFEKLFPSGSKSVYKFKLNNNKVNIDKLNINFEDGNLNKSAIIEAKPFIVEYSKKANAGLTVIKGRLNMSENTAGEFDINTAFKYPFPKSVDSELLSGHCIIYNIDLDLIKPFIQKYTDRKITELSGFIDFLQLSADKSDNKTTQIVLNTTFNNLIYNRIDWNNSVNAKGANKISLNLELEKNKTEIKSFSYTADNINIKTNGEIEFKKNPVLDINTEITDSKAENIAAVLPPNLIPQYMTIEKIKNYGIFGDLEANVHVKGTIPQPDITGYVKGRNVHILDKSIHNLHKGSVDIKFNKRILDMNIIVDLFDNQKAEVKGYTYMFRDGINNVSVKTTDNIDFPLAQKIIIPISKVFNFQLGPIPEMDITSGKGIIDLDIKGSMDLIDINGYSEFNNAKLTYNGLFGEVHDGKGRLDFNGDIVSFKSEKAFVKNNSLNIDGKVKINDNLDFNISSKKADSKDVLEIINKSELLKDVKEGLAVITDASGDINLLVNIKAKIVPVPYGHPPLPPEEAFEDMRVKGSVYMLGDSCKIEGFYTPIENIKGIVDFTETITYLHALEAVSGTSPITISGQIINDLETKVPDIDITVTGKEINLKDTVRFLSQSYMYPANYPDISCLYKIASKHDLYFKYKAKSIDFITDKAYAVMNFINDNTESALKAKSGRIVMENSSVKVEDVKAALFDSDLNISGTVNHVDTVNPEYNLKIYTNKVNIANLNDTSKLDILPAPLKEILDSFTDYKGFADINITLNKNIPDGEIKLNGLNLKHIKTNIPFNFDDFTVFLNKNRIYMNNITAQIDDVPFYGNLIISDCYKIPDVKGFFTSKITNNFIENYISELAEKFKVAGDINLSAKFNGTSNNFNIEPKLVLNQEADIIYDGTSLGETNEKREFNGNININKSKINVKKLDYIKYVSSQNNKTYPITFANINGILKQNKDNLIIPEEINIKTNKNISARVLNIFLKKQILNQGTFNCDLKYITDNKTGLGKLLGNIDCRNIDIPVFDTLVKNIKINAGNDNIDINLFGFISDSRIRINSILENQLGDKPKIKALNIYANSIDSNKLFKNLAKAHNAMNTNNNLKNIDMSNLSIENGYLDIETLNIKSMVANNFKSNFSIDENGIFHANNTSVNVGSGTITADIHYDLVNTEFKGDFELTNVDANYAAETLFDGKNQIYGNANGKIIIETKGLENDEIIKNLNGYVYFDISDGRMPKLGSLEYLLRASNIVKSGITGFTLNSILELLNLVKTGYFSNINGSCKIENGIAKDIQIFSQGDNLSLYIHGQYDISRTHADMEILGKLSKKISTVLGTLGNTSLNTFFKLIPGISLLDFSRKNFNEDVEKIPAFTNGRYDARTFQAIINGDINDSGYVQSFKWVE